MDGSALFVTTVPITLEAFLVPFAEHFRVGGWRVDVLANGASMSESFAAHFDHRYDGGWTRSALDPHRQALAPPSPSRYAVSCVKPERWDDRVSGRIVEALAGGIAPLAGH